MMGISEIRKQTRSIWTPSAMQTLLVALMCVLITVSRSDFSVQHWMSLLYPIMTATCFMAAVVMILYYISVRPVRLVLATAFYLISETAVLALLTLTTHWSHGQDFLTGWLWSGSSTTRLAWSFVIWKN